MITIADREISRRHEIEKNLEYISRQLGQLRVIKELPDIDIPSGPVVNRAIDVLSSSLNYVAVHIRYESNLLGIMGSQSVSNFKC